MTEPALQSVAMTRSPALRGFELNPFRALRLPVNASSNDAAFRADSALTLARLGLPPEEEDPLPWLPGVTIYELQRTAQTVEEPLVRLKQQLLWFDFVRDERAAVLASALRDPRGPALQQYLQEELQLGEATAPNGESSCDVHRIAHAVNQANLRLLVAASLVSGVVAAPSNGLLAAKRIAQGQWKTLHGLAVLPEAHEILLDGTGTDAAADPRIHWSGGLRRWMRILPHPWFRSYLETCIAELGDDFVGADDAETVEASIRIHLADLSAQETRFLLLEGRYRLAASMIAAVADSGLDAQILGPAMRPLRHVMQSELSELRPLLDGPEENDLGTIDVYLKRLGAIRQRWQAVDPSGIVGLLDVIDEAVEQAYLRLRNRYKPADHLDSLLAKVGEMATAQSLRARVSASKAELAEVRSRFCHFCRSEPPDFDKAVVLKGRKDTHVERHGNLTITNYTVVWRPLRRCARCARFHDYMRTTVTSTVLGGVASLAGIAFIVNSVVTDLGCVLFAGFIVTSLVFGSVCQNLLLRMLTPKNHRRYGDYRDSEEARRLSAEGYSGVEVDWSSNAWASIKKN
jgi:hypothetical protein